MLSVMLYKLVIKSKSVNIKMRGITLLSWGTVYFVAQGGLPFEFVGQILRCIS